MIAVFKKLKKNLTAKTFNSTLSARMVNWLLQPANRNAQKVALCYNLPVLSGSCNNTKNLPDLTDLSETSAEATNSTRPFSLASAYH